MVYACNWCQFRAMSAAFFLPYKVKTLREESAIEMSTGKNINFVRLVFGSDPQSWSIVGFSNNNSSLSTTWKA